VKRLVFFAFLILIVIFPAGACGGEEAPPNQSNERISITNDENDLEGRLRTTNQDIPVDATQTTLNSSFLPGPNQFSVATADGGGRAIIRLAEDGTAESVTLTLVAEVTPPIVEGQMIQATSVAIKGNYAYISYNMRGESYLGAIEVIDIKNPDSPKLVSQAIFLDSDVHSLTYDGGRVYTAGATNDPAFEYPAVLERIQIKNGKLILEDNERVAMTSFAGTSVVASGNKLYATSGNNGGLLMFTEQGLEFQQQVDLDDARWVDIEGSKVVVAQGTPGRISVIDKDSLELLNTFSFDGADIPESKTTVEVLGGKAFIAAGTGGVQVLSINTGQVVGTVPLPIIPGLDPSVVVTNAVSGDGKLLFISNGEAGVYLARAPENFTKTGSEDLQELELVGKLQFGGLESVNHVAYEKNMLFVASGLGGLKIVTVEE